jgi:hypothetical protein
MRAKISASQACGSTSLRRAVMISVITTAARSAPRSEPANNQARLPRARPRRLRSAALFVKPNRAENVLEDKKNDIFTKIERLANLQQKGVISAEEFAAKKNELLSRL